MCIRDSFYSGDTELDIKGMRKINVPRREKITDNEINHVLISGGPERKMRLLASTS